MKNAKSFACATMLALALSATAFGKSGTISGTKAGTISGTRNGTIAATSSGIIPTAPNTRIDSKFRLFELLITTFLIW